MPKRAVSSVKGLHKHHSRGCANQTGPRPAACDCPWYGHYKGIQKGLEKWAEREVDPRSRGRAEAVFSRLKTAIDSGTYDAGGEHLSLGSAQLFRAFVDEWRKHYAKEHGLTATSLEPMLGVLIEEFGGLSLEQLAGASLRIERWLNETKHERRWSDNTWNRYYELLNSLFNRAAKWRVNNVPRMRLNPMSSIDRRPGSSVKFETRSDEKLEDRLLAACDRLNRPQHQPHSRILTWDKVRSIRTRAKAGESQRSLAQAHGISTGLCCQVVKGDVWNPERYRIGTKGTEMRRRVYAAFDLGLRAAEVLALQLKHIDFKPVAVKVDGKLRHVLVIALPATLTKGGKTTGEIEHVYAGSERLKKELVRRRFQLKRNPDAFVFGTEDGRRVRGFRRMWRELFRLSGLEFGRDKGLTWHTIRHKDGRTTQRYMHARHSHLLAAAVRLNRR